MSVISTACINNLAVQELNNKAKEYMNNGETEKAICRLRSSIDLDDSIFETHYNLGVALIENKEYKEAKDSLDNAIKLKPDFAASYYSLAIAFENMATEKSNPNNETDSEDNEESEIQPKQEKDLSDVEKREIVELYNSAVENYNTYLAKETNADDEEKVSEQIKYINQQIDKYNTSINKSLSVDTTQGEN